MLFESAADVFGERLLAVILSGANADGAAGLSAVRTKGGTTVVQRPEDAEQALMPRAAIEASTPSAVLSLEAVASLFARFRGSARSEHERHSAGGHV